MQKSEDILVSQIAPAPQGLIADGAVQRNRTHFEEPSWQKRLRKKSCDRYIYIHRNGVHNITDSCASS
jgi:hypothetical protein